MSVSKAKTKSMVEAAGKYIGSTKMGAPMKVQQRLYERARKVIPREYWDSAFEEGAVWWNERGMKGPGVDW